MDETAQETPTRAGEQAGVLRPSPRRGLPGRLRAELFAPAGSPGARRRERVLAFLVLALTSACLLVYWHRYAPVVPEWDGWFWIGQGKAFAEGGFARLLHETHPLVYNEHLYLLPSALALLLGPLFDYSFRPLAFLAVVSVLGCGWVAFRAARAGGIGPLAASFVFLSVATLRHWENLLLGFQLGLPMCVLFGCAALYVAHARKDVRGLLLAGALCVASALCSSGGFALVPVMFLVRWFDLARPRIWIWLGVSAAVILPLLHFLLLYLYGVSFIAAALAKVSLNQWAEILQHAAKVLGGGVVGGRAAAPLGLALGAGACALIVARVRAQRRIDVVSGFALWGLVNALTIAAARQPFLEPASRHEIFVAPAIGACAIGLVGLLRQLTSARAPVWTALLVGQLWCFSDNWLDARNYTQIVADSGTEVRCALVSMANGEVLTDEELAHINPYPPEHVRGLLQFVIDRKWLIFSGGRAPFEEHRELPGREYLGAHLTRTDGVVEVSGPGYVGNDLVVPFDSPCIVDLIVEASVTGTVTAGVLQLGEGGDSQENSLVNLAPNDVFARGTVQVTVAPGTRLRPYVYANSPQDRARIRSFVVRLVEAGR